MSADVTLQAGPQLHALFGHIICVAGQDLQLGADGLMRAPAEAAKILLAQDGWRASEPQQVEEDEAPQAEAGEDEPTPRRRRGGSA